MVDAVRVATANIAKENKHPGRAIRAVLLVADLVFFEEVETRRARARLRVLALVYGFGVVWGKRHSRYGRAANAVPIAYRKAMFSVEAVHVVRTMVGILHDSPSRFIIRATLRHVSGILVPGIATHMIQQAWTTRPGHRKAWRHHAKLLRAEIRAAAAQADRFVGGGDFNRDRWRIGTGVTMIYAKAGTVGAAHYDGLYCGGDIRPLGKARRVTLPGSDHHGIVAQVTL